MKLPHWLRRLLCSHSIISAQKIGYHCHLLCWKCNTCVGQIDAITGIKLRCRAAHTSPELIAKAFEDAGFPIISPKGKA
jgi:hypothetical protein